MQRTLAGHYRPANYASTYYQHKAAICPQAHTTLKEVLAKCKTIVIVKKHKENS